MRFGQNAVKTPGRARENHCVTKGLRFRAALFKGWQVQGGALVAPAGAKHPRTSRSKTGRVLRNGLSCGVLAFPFTPLVCEVTARGRNGPCLGRLALPGG